MNQRGMILVIIILMLAVLALLILTQLQSVFLYYKSLNRALKKHDAFYQLESAANHLLNHNVWSNQEACVIDERTSHELIKLLKNKQACLLTYEEEPFFYLIETLGDFPCLQIKLGDRIYSTQHLRINIMTTHNPPAFLQLRIAKPVQLILCENTKPTLIKQRLLSWHYLSTIA